MTHIKNMSEFVRGVVAKALGGEGSGNFDHGGLAGVHGGSSSGSGKVDSNTSKNRQNILNKIGLKKEAIDNIIGTIKSSVSSVTGIYVVGSRASGQYKQDSDIDLVIVDPSIETDITPFMIREEHAIAEKYIKINNVFNNYKNKDITQDVDIFVVSSLERIKKGKANFQLL